jgi:hypothetical protein
MAKDLGLMNRNRVGAQTAQKTDGLPVLFASLVNLSFLLVLMFFAGLRELPVFWTDAGGWPVWLRGLVEVGFYPMFFVELALLGLLSVFGVNLAGARHPSAGVSVVLLWFAWLLLFTVVAVVAANNLENLISGRPLHWHAALP